MMFSCVTYADSGEEDPYVVMLNVVLRSVIMLSAVVPVKLFSVLQVCVEPMTTGPNVIKLFT